MSKPTISLCSTTHYEYEIKENIPMLHVEPGFDKRGWVILLRRFNLKGELLRVEWVKTKGSPIHATRQQALDRAANHYDKVVSLHECLGNGYDISSNL